MPFVSEAQRRYLFATKPGVAKEFAEATPKGATLPEHVSNRAEIPASKQEVALRPQAISSYTKRRRRKNG